MTTLIDLFAQAIHVVELYSESLNAVSFNLLTVVQLVPKVGQQLTRLRLTKCVARSIYGSRASVLIILNDIQGGPKKRGQRLITIILSYLNVSLEDSLVNLQLNGY